jgi:uncharacterized delta-60 repeat protein
VVQPDGRVVVGGLTRPLLDPYVDPLGDFVVARYLDDGTLDPTFGDGGVVMTDLGSGDVVWDLALLPDGRIVAGGSVGEEFGIAVYFPDGTPDPSFGGDGTVVTTVEIPGGEQDLSEFEHGIRGVALQQDGRIVVAGMANVDIEVHRYLQDGTLDPTFSGDGVLIVDTGGWDYCRDVAIDGQGRIVLGSYTEDRASKPTVADYLPVRILPTGDLDPSFGAGGLARLDYGGWERVRGVALQPDGKIVLAGGSNPAELEAPDTSVVRLLEDGTADPRFGDGGSVVVDQGDEDAARAVTVDANGAILTVGISSGNFAAMRLLGE